MADLSLADLSLADLLAAAAGLLLLIAAVGLIGARRGGAVGRMMALSLLGTCSIAVLLLLSLAQRTAAALDVALLLALLTPCAVAALGGRRKPGGGRAP